MTDKLILKGVMSQGYGTVPKLVMRDKHIDSEAKAIYAYICSFAGTGTSAFPGIKIMCEELPMSEKRFHKFKNQLIDNGYLHIERERKSDGSGWGNNIYHLIQEVPDKEKKQTVTGQNDRLQTVTGQSVTLQNVTRQDVTLQNDCTINNSSINNSTNKDIPPKSKKRIYETNSIYYKMAESLFLKIQTNNPEVKKPNLQNWSDDVRKMIELDGRKVEQVTNMISWSQSNDFWSGVILSTGKLREKYDQMRIQANNSYKPVKKAYNNTAPIRKETLPDWVGKKETKETEVSDAEKETFKERLNKLRA